MCSNHKCYIDRNLEPRVLVSNLYLFYDIIEDDCLPTHREPSEESADQEDMQVGSDCQESSDEQNLLVQGGSEGQEPPHEESSEVPEVSVHQEEDNNSSPDLPTVNSEPSKSSFSLGLSASPLLCSTPDPPHYSESGHSSSSLPGHLSGRDQTSSGLGSTASTSNCKGFASRLKLVEKRLDRLSTLMTAQRGTPNRMPLPPASAQKGEHISKNKKGDRLYGKFFLSFSIKFWRRE